MKLIQLLSDLKYHGKHSLDFSNIKNQNIVYYEAEEVARPLMNQLDGNLKKNES